MGSPGDATDPSVRAQARQSVADPAVTGHAFRPHQRLHHGGDYSRVFNRQQKAAGRHCVLLVRPTKPGRPARLGMMVPVKAVRLAVRRHQLKRWVRELFRLELAAACVGHDLVVLFRGDPPVADDAHRRFDDELRALLPKALQGVAQPRPKGRRR